jgi:hypothetical protein
MKILIISPYSNFLLCAVCKMLFDLSGGTKDYLQLEVGPEGVQYTVCMHSLLSLVNFFRDQLWPGISLMN